MKRYISVTMLAALVLGCSHSVKVNSQVNVDREMEERRDLEVRALEKQAEELAAKIKADETPMQMAKDRLDQLRNQARAKLLEEMEMDIK